MTKTNETLQMSLDIREALFRSSKIIEIEWLSDNGEWISRACGDEYTAREFEQKLDKDGIQHRRVGR